MSYEGFSQVLCEKGHYHTINCYNTPHDWDEWKCDCGAKKAHENMVNETNGESVGYIEMERIVHQKCDKCNSTLEQKYKVPDNYEKILKKRAVERWQGYIDETRKDLVYQVKQFFSNYDLDEEFKQQFVKEICLDVGETDE